MAISLLPCNLSINSHLKPCIRSHTQVFNPLCQHHDLAINSKHNHGTGCSLSGTPCHISGLVLVPSNKKPRDLVVHASPETGDFLSDVLPLLPSGENSWISWAVGFGLAIPLLTARLYTLSKKVDAAAESAEKVADAIGKVAEEVDKAAEDFAERLPEGGKLRNIVESIEHFAEETVKDAQFVEDLMDKAESSLNAVALKKFVEENQRLAVECSNLLAQCKRWEKECSLYDHDREALMDFGNEADERAKVAESRVHELEEEVHKLSEELHFYKSQFEAQADDTATADASVEQNLLNSLLETVIDRDDFASTAHSFLEANSGTEVCQRLLKMWKQLRPSTHKAIALAAEVKTLQEDKEHLRINLHRAEDEVKVLFEENNILDKENERLIRLYQKEKHTPGSGRKPSSAKGNKRKSGPEMRSPVEKKIDFNEVDSLRQHLSPLQENSPEYRSNK